MTTQRSILLAAAVLSLAACRAACLGADPPAAEYLSDSLFDRVVSVTQAWGELGVNTGVRPPGGKPMKLRIKDKEYEHGLGHHASGEIVVDLGGQFKTFQTDIGIQWQGGQNLASAIFQIYVDDRKVFESGIVHENDPPRQVTVSVEGAEELRLVTGDAGDGITCDCTNWADARLVRNPSAPKRAPAAGVDVAPFGQVVTFDPKVAGGTKAGRVDEFPAEDLFPARELLPAADGSYTVADWAGTGSIGLRWDENRLLRRLVLRFADAAAVPPPEAIRLQTWSGESAWQGAWQPVDVRAERDGNSLIWQLGYRGLVRGTQKVRWLFPAMKQPIVLAGLSTYTRSGWNTVDVRFESARPRTSPKAEIELYNGVILGTSSPLSRSGRGDLTWDPAKPLELRIRSSIPKRYKADRTVLRFRFPDRAFAVAIEDLLANDCVYVPHAGLFVTRVPAPVTLDEYLKKISSKSGVLAEVRKRPDQDFARAMAVVHNPIQDLGPMMLSLACDNRKFVVHRDGTVVFDEYTGPDDKPRDSPSEWRLVPRFGSGRNAKIERRILAWCPMPETIVTEGTVEYRQWTVVSPVLQAPRFPRTWLREHAVCAAHYFVNNNGTAAADARLAINFEGAKKRPIGLSRAADEDQGEEVVVTAGNRLLAVIDLPASAEVKVKEDGTGVVLSGRISARGGFNLSVCLPAWSTTVSDLSKGFPPIDRPCLPNLVGLYWEDTLASAMEAQLPDWLLTNAIRASQVHSMLAARSEEHGRLVSPWISSDRYGPLESEANSIIRGMDMMGHAEFARRSLEFFIKRYNKAGYLTTGYTMVGTGEHLWTLAEHYQRTRDRAWIEKIAPEVARVCQWIVRERAKTKRLDARGQKVPEYGLMPPGVTADWNRYAYRFFNDAQYCAGLEAAARVLADVGHPAAPALLEDARQYREDLLRAYRWTQARSPVVRLDNGTWVPDGPAILDCFGRTEDFLPGEDGNRNWCYGIEAGAHHLAATGILDPAAEEVAWMADYLEDVQFLRSGMGDYPEEKNRSDVLSFGGFAKLQPYYVRIAELYAMRDDVKPFVRSYFNTIPSLLSRENLSFWEHFHNTGGWNKTHETGWFLCQSRLMLVMERGEALWLAPMVTNRWMKDGMKVAVRNAPTRFGKVTYAITSAAAAGHIDAVIEPQERLSARRIVIRLRHPDGKPMRAVTVGGNPHKDFDPQKETVTLVPPAGPITVRAQY